MPTNKSSFVGFRVCVVIVFGVFVISACSQVRLTPEARKQQCLEYGQKEGTPEFGECMQKEREMAQDFWWGDAD